MNTTSSTDTKQKLFVTGATGFVGGTFITTLLSSPQASKWHISVLVRSKDAAAAFEKLGLTPILGSLEDTEVLKKAVLDADVTINIADADNFAAIKTIVDALATGGKRRILIHTSGTAFLVDNAKGEHANAKVVSDLDVDYVHAIPVEIIHRNVDSYIFDNSKNFEAIVVCPSSIYGIGTGLFKKNSMIIPALIRSYIQTGRTGIIGKGANIWNTVHVEDLADFYLLLLQKAWEGKASTGRDALYFVENGEYNQKEVASEVAKQLYKHGAVKQAEVDEYTTEEVDKYFGILGWFGLASNSRSSADRTRALGWKPSGTRPKIVDSLAREVEDILAQEKAK